jgi:hypothetical protein
MTFADLIVGLVGFVVLYVMWPARLRVELYVPSRKRKHRRRVYIETPFRTDSDAGRSKNREYLLSCMRDSVDRGEAPIASHLIFTQFLDDDVPAEREVGIACGLAWAAVAEATVVYTDLEISVGMRQGIEDAVAHGRPVEYRILSSEAAIETVEEAP